MLLVPAAVPMAVAAASPSLQPQAGGRRIQLVLASLLRSRGVVEITALKGKCLQIEDVLTAQSLVDNMAGNECSDTPTLICFPLCKVDVWL
eukprot:5862921-Amphidinium_carterae.1